MAVEAGSVIVRFRGDTTQFKGAVKSFNAELGRIAKRAAIVGAAIAGIAAKMAADFDRGMREISTLLSDVTENDIKVMGREIRQLGIETGQALEKLTKARYDIISAGFSDAADSAVMLETSAKLAVGGVSDVAKTTDLLTSAVNSYGLSAKHVTAVSDIMFTTVKLGKTTIDELTKSMGKLMPISRSAGLTLESTGAMMAALTAGGMATREAAVYARSALMALSAPVGAAKDAMEQLELQMYKNADGTTDLYKTIEQFQGMPIDVIRKVIPDKTAATTILLLAQNLDKLDSSLEGMEDTAGATEEAYQKMLQSYSVQLNQFKNIVQDTMIELGSEILPAIMPAIKQIGKILTDNAEKISNFFSGVGKAITYLAEDVNRAITILGGLTLAINIAKGAMIAFNLATSANPIMLILKTVISLGILLYGLAKQLGGFDKIFEYVADVATASFQTVKNVGYAAVMTVWEWIKFFADVAKTRFVAIGKAFKAVFNFIGNVGGRIFTELGKRITNLFKKKENKESVKKFGEIIAEEFNKALSEAESSIQSVEERADEAREKVADLWADVGDPWEDVGEPPTIKKPAAEPGEGEDTGTEQEDIESDYRNEEADEFRRALAKIREAYADNTDSANEQKEAINELSGVYRELGQAASSVLSSMNNSFETFFDNVMDRNVSLEEAFDNLWENILRSFINMITSMIAKLVTFTIIYTALNAITGGGLGALLAGGNAVKSGPFFQGLGSFMGGNASPEMIGKAFQMTFDSVGDAVITPEGKIIRTSPSDYLFAVADPGSVVKNIAGNTYNQNIINRSVVGESGGNGIGGDEIHLHIDKIETLDAKSFEQYMSRNGRTLVKTYDRAKGRGY